MSHEQAHSSMAVNKVHGIMAANVGEEFFLLSMGRNVMKVYSASRHTRVYEEFA